MIVIRFAAAYYLHNQKQPINVRHGHTSKRKQSDTYSSWAAMLTRVRNPNIPSAKYYSVRGITVCKRWLKFENFLEDMGLCPSDRHASGRRIYSIERENNEGNYEPGNCKWATQKEQVNNSRPRTPRSKKGVTKKCIVCESEFYVERAKADKRKCCSPECKAVSLRSNVKPPCPVCGGYVAPHKHNCCSLECAQEYTKMRIHENDTPERKRSREYIRQYRERRRGLTEQNHGNTTLLEAR